MHTLGEKIKEVRIRQNMTQRVLAEKSGISAKMLRNYETGHNEPGAAALSWLALTLGVSSDWLLGIQPVQSPSPDFPSVLAAADRSPGR